MGLTIGSAAGGAVAGEMSVEEGKREQRLPSVHKLN